MPRPIHFEIHASDPGRAMAFYRALFARAFTRWDGPMEYRLIKTDAGGPGIDGGLLRRLGAPPAEGAPVNAGVCTVDVPSADATLARVPGLGGTIAVPKMAFPGIGWRACAKDPEGNIWGFMQMDPTAA